MKHLRLNSAVVSLFSLLAIANANAESILGGISGGGGTVLAANQAGENAIRQYLYDARIELTAIFNSLSYTAVRPDALPELQMMFSGPRTIFDVIREESISEQDSCVDSAGTPKDGSIFGAAPHSICLSIPRLGTELSIDEARAQTLALAAHEYSHLLGTTEPQAIALQTYVLNYIRQGQFNTNEGWITFSKARFQTDEMVRSLSLLDSTLSSENNPKICQLAQDAKTQQDALSDYIEMSAPYSAIPQASYSAYSDSKQELYAIETQLCSNNPDTADSDAKIQGLMSYLQALHVFLDRELNSR